MPLVAITESIIYLKEHVPTTSLPALPAHYEFAKKHSFRVHPFSITAYAFGLSHLRIAKTRGSPTTSSQCLRLSPPPFCGSDKKPNTSASHSHSLQNGCSHIKEKR
ncbi:hypothetical protein TGME49_224560 [Toxoplasma gondii ME49]|uniref:Uncharacterized protein n=10 Tax=Toxoplasma gondii TaxID=5811 RepID=A0A125YXU1_TOXGV|nr:hypothetical protein TGME49_224560 [Toxoplasma gondii ME49]ESS32478.1 hypothetical protein TGVEG_224560 [Toxoplasma gondii VEG]KFG43091.1 hypothetical protein TGP89_224560 [Toxoplasma gondii p89]KFG45661.1 hypothetical protein TGDOM2_224560 [Toxoplasma gondii GAB2-2007-GAL-DOM2]KFG55007.1 hypothetical protein TGFOU_224560 [Toxoplasma gondii FOU]KFG60701.1 hypothetical protein TGRUB_224560 [Toxoplasma gondii RUB]KFH13438.1 hypothetical protein TGVAND_224560 [Toxoplasma gondii VAND]KYF42139|eukprot:XP_018635946.1 hypothetical protein TGME49_224560 [Toxoplasma gondii ME49]